jgi:hypothetical protein
MDDTAIAEEILAYLGAEGVELSDDLTQVEPVVLEQVRRIGARVIELHLSRQQLGYESSRSACPCGRTQRFVEYRPKTVATLLGVVRIRRAYYRCRVCGRSSLPYDSRVGLGDGPESVGLAKAATLLGVHEPFQGGARLLYELTGQRLSPSTVERLTERVGAAATAQEAEQAARIADWDTPPAEVAPERLYVAVDGTMVHREDGWREAKCVTCYWDEPDGTRSTRYGVRFDDVRHFVGFVWALACRCGLEQAREVVLLGDGARWIWDHVGGLLKEATLIVDWYHAVEHLWECGRILHGEGTEATAAWVAEHKDLLWAGNRSGLVRSLRGQLARARGPTRRSALHGLITYVENQGERLAYDRFRARGLDIGSGRVEAACKHVVGARMKRNGMRWSPAGAQTTLSLRTVWLNGQWDAFWSQRPLRTAA